MNSFKLDNLYQDSYLIYTRKSTDDAHNQKNSIDYQVNEAIAFSKKNNLPIANITIAGFCDNGIIKERHSGYKQDKNFEILDNSQISQRVERPKFLTLISLLQKKQIKGVVCLCWDRISRNENDDVLIKKLINSGIDLKFVQVTYDDTSSGALHMDIDGMFSRHYSRVISEKVTNALKKLRAEGKCTYRAPLGYLNQGSDNKILDPKIAPYIKMMFEMYATGEWSMTSLMHWANKNNITSIPRRRNRSKEEKLNDVTPASIIPTTRPLTKKSIENMLKNQFYIGNIFYEGTYIKGRHQPLLDSSLFFKVQSVMQQKSRHSQKPHLDFYTYRNMIQCPFCKRIYTPYTQKGISYLLVNCKSGCKNTRKNITEAEVTNEIQKVLHTLYLTDTEKADIEKDALEQLNQITDRRNRELVEVYAKIDKLMKDLDYLCKEKLSFLRNNVMSIEEIKNEEIRLQNEIEDCKTKIAANTDSSEHMLNYIILFSEIIKSSADYFKHALDNEKVEIINQIFFELYFSQEGLKYVAKQGFSALFARNDVNIAPFGAVKYLFSELQYIYPSIKKCSDVLQVYNRR